MSALILPKFLLKYSKWMDVKAFKKVDLQNKWIKNNSETYFLKENLNWIEYKNGVKIDSYEEIPTEFNYVLMYSEKTKIYNILTSSDLFSGKNLQNMKFIDEGKWDLTIESPIFVENEKAKTKWLKLDGGNSYYIKENYTWIEKYENGGIAGIFEEIYSDPNYLILFDSKRNFFVKLTDDVAYWGINDKIMFYLSDGKWKEKELESEEINADNIKNQINSIRQSLKELIVNSEQSNNSSTHKLRTTNEENYKTEKLSPEDSVISIEQDQNNSEKFKTHIQETIQQPLDTKQTILTRYNVDNNKNKEENQNFEILNAQFQPIHLSNSVISFRQDQDNLEKLNTNIKEEEIQQLLDTEQTKYNVDNIKNKEEIENFEILNAKFESNNLDTSNEKLKNSINKKRESVVDNFIDHQYNIDSQYIDHLKKITANIDNDIESIISNRISIDNILNKFENNKINLEEEILKAQSKQAVNIENLSTEANNLNENSTKKEDIPPTKNNSNKKNSNCSLKIKAQNNSKFVNLKKITVNSDFSLDEFDLKNNQENINITNNKLEGNCSKESIDIKVTLNFNLV
jgi:hypothetical protein